MAYSAEAVAFAGAAFLAGVAFLAAAFLAGPSWRRWSSWPPSWSERPSSRPGPPSSSAPDPWPASRRASRTGLLDGQLLRGLPAPQRRVELAVGHVRAEPALLDHHRLLGDRVRAHLPQRRGGGPALPGLGRGEQRQRLVQRDGEQLLLAVQRAEVVAALDVRAVPPVGRDDLRALRVLAEQPRGSVSSRSACSSVTVSGDCVLSSDDLRSPLDTYGP